MVNILIAFVTGLTTGGLSCLAVQGGLLASSLTNQIENDVQQQVYKPSRKRIRRAQRPARAGMARPIAAFLAAKLIAYTLLGLLLGWLGQMVQLSPYARAGLQIAIGIFMLGNALRMLNVHPIFRYFAIEPPAFIRRRLRRFAKDREVSLAAPVFLGFLTVLIPCGVTQAMLAAALGTGSPLGGAALMFAFTLGTSPVFFAVAYFATTLGQRLERNFNRFVAIVLLLLAVYTIDTGVALAGSPMSLTRSFNEMFARPAAVEQPAGSPPYAAVDGENTVTIRVLNTSYEPGVVHAPAGVPVKLRLVTEDVVSCSRAFVIPALGVQQLLERTGEAVIEIPPQEAGTQMAFSCSMGMFGGTLVFDL
ncbi:MAG TPA: hypothetical protein GYA06_08225 [Chloroflexi bacterium]|nr:hypothetical protein [Chloroflexota bacterium]HPO57815.1 sulfite exporter TauE/SafE family protein [Anaerolineaceae bacterium]